MGEKKATDNVMPAESSPNVPQGMIRLVSSDGFSFTVDQEYAMLSAVVRTMMRSPFKESKTRVVHLRSITGSALEIICQYLYYIPRHHSRQEQALSSSKNGDGGCTSAIDSFLESFDVPPELSVEVLIGARFLEL